MATFPLSDRRSRQEAAGVVGGLFERHGRMVYGVCRAMLRDVQEAEDATQQVFLSAHQALLGGVHVRESGSWLATIARNECRRRIAAGMRQPLPVTDEDLDALPAVADEQERHARLEEIRAGLAELPERQREAVVLRYFYGLRYGEVATALGLSRPATEALLFRARRSLRIRLKPVVGAVLVVPSVVRDELALALPGFGATGCGGAMAAASGGVIAKLAAGPVGVKAATAVVAVSTVGAVGSVSTEQSDRVERLRPLQHVVASPSDGFVQRSARPDRSDASSRGVGDRGSGRRPQADGSSGSGSGGGHDDDRSGGGTTSNASGPGGGTGGGRSGHEGAAETVSPPTPPAPDGSGDESGGGGRGSDGGSSVSSSGPSQTSGSGSSGSGGGPSSNSGSGSSFDNWSAPGSNGSGLSGDGKPDD